jgi:hypothetical protein
MLRKWLACFIVIAVVCTCVVPGRADEGLWTFDHFPSARVKALYGATVDQAWLGHVMRSAVYLSNGCSASIVSAAGLVLTNNHCVTECTQEISNTDSDHFTSGFIADDRREEKRCNNLSALVILSTSDVTQRMFQAGKGLDAAHRLQAQASVSKEIEASACAGDSYTLCRVTKLYSGAQYQLFRYRKFEDVRLTFSPGTTMSMFGDGEDVPRTFDVALLRLYNNNEPAVTQEHLKWNSSAPSVGEVVFVMGFPRISERQLTASQLQTERDFSLPVEIRQRDELNKRLAQFDQKSRENRDAGEYAVSDSLNHTQYIKVLERALHNDGFVDQKLKEEAGFCVEDPALQTQLAVIVDAEKARRVQALPRQFLVGGPFYDGASSRLFSYARTLVRGALERAKPASERMPGYTDADLREEEQELFAKQRVYAPLERLILNFWLDEAQRLLPSNDSTLKLLLDGRTAQDVARSLSESRLGDVAVRKRLWEGGLASVQNSDDPMIRYVLRTEPAAQMLQAKWQANVVEPEDQASAAIATARLRMDQANIYPDANRTLRLSFGKIDGFRQGGRYIEPFTTISSLFKNVAGADTHQIDSRWAAARGRLDGATVLNMFTTNDGINGNSGSALLNAQGEVIGAFYGGNSYASAGDYGYDPKHNRALAVSAAAVNEALVRVYGAQSLTTELATGRP